MQVHRTFEIRFFDTDVFTWSNKNRTTHQNNLNELNNVQHKTKLKSNDKKLNCVKYNHRTRLTFKLQQNN